MSSSSHSSARLSRSSIAVRPDEIARSARLAGIWAVEHLLDVRIKAGRLIAVGDLALQAAERHGRRLVRDQVRDRGTSLRTKLSLVNYCITWLAALPSILLSEHVPISVRRVGANEDFRLLAIRRRSHIIRVMALPPGTRSALRTPALGLEDHIVDRLSLDRADSLFRAARIVLSSFAELAEPARQGGLGFRGEPPPTGPAPILADRPEDM